ncbi:MAG: NADH-quinone oxidoreductase subunit L [Bacteroidia bacterium]|nr:NADH-quinone oxidoreductase subunit L [Bacteroidia bacterium]MCZ2248366.1 NADH-quinone oxidoreductase subunit L [Bacteroidia bacterium]
MIKLVALVPLFPLLGFTITGLFSKSLSKSTASTIAGGSVLLSFIISLLLFFQVNQNPEVSHTVKLFDWIYAGKFSADLAFLIDPLSSIFLLVITGVGFLIHVYSAGYMHDDEGHNKFFSYLNLFVFFMLLLVLGNNYIVMFIGWEGVGLCSYLLIGFWFKNTDYNNAGKKAFIVNRIGDLGFLLGVFLIYVTFGSVTYTDVFSQAKFYTSDESVLVFITLLLFVGATGKSAQIPLYTWLPDAMAGPTPVSALIHAATMVTAGIYMVARSNILYTLAPTTMHIVALVGVITAVFAASIGLLQNDIKKVLAYSTVSQLGYMFLALGMGAYTAAVFHVVTHAFFKALLFLGAGSVIHAMGGEQDIRKMGGLKSHLPTTYLTFLIGTIAIAGLPPLSGFFSKDEILAAAFAHNKIFWLLGVAGSALTAFYMFRLLFLTFFGKFRGTHHQEQHLHESPKSITIPLVVLAVLSAIGGFIGIPEAFHAKHLLKSFLSPVFADSDLRMLPAEISHATEYSLMALTIVIAVVVILLARNKYVTKQELPLADGATMTPIAKLISHKYYVDELYNYIIVVPLRWVGQIFHSLVDTQIIDGLVNFTGKAVVWTSGEARKIQTGRIGYYVFVMVLSIVLLLLYISN